MAKTKDSKYELVKPLVEGGNVPSFTYLFKNKVVGITQFIQDLGAKHNTMHRKIYKPERLKVEDLYKISEVLGITRHQLLTLIENDITSPIAKKTRSVKQTKDAPKH